MEALMLGESQRGGFSAARRFRILDKESMSWKISGDVAKNATVLRVATPGLRKSRKSSA